MSLTDALPILKTRLELSPSITTVLDYVPETDPKESDLPLIAIKVLAAKTHNDDGSIGGYMDRRTLLWPLELYTFGCIRSEDISADLATVFPLWEEIVGILDGDISLSGTLDGVITYPDPMGGDPGMIMWNQTKYTGFVLYPTLPILTATVYG